MKKNTAFVFFVTLAFISCKEEEHVQLNAAFSVNNSLFQIAEPVALTNRSDSVSVLYRWDFGDGSTSEERDPVHAYNAAGVYEIKLIVRDQAGNSASTTGKVTIGEVYVYELDINRLNPKKWFSPENTWDPDSSGTKSLPDVFFEIKDGEGMTLYESETRYNVEQNQLPLRFEIPDVKINGSRGGTESGIWLKDRDPYASEMISSNQMSGRSYWDDVYHAEEHKGKYSVGLGDYNFTVKYLVR